MSEDPLSILPRRLGRRAFVTASAAGALVGWGCSKPEPVARGATRVASGRGAPVNAWPRLLAGRDALDGDQARVRRLFPQVAGDHQDPFVLLDDFRVAPPAGFPLHPHRGFEAFTYMLDGAFHHRDTMGNDSIVHTGGTQRFTSGRGARHSEMPAAPQVNRGLQLWVNLPRELKAIEPEYAAVDGADIPEEGRRGAIVRTVVGPGSPSRLRTAVTYLDLSAPEAGVRHEAEVPSGHKALVYVVDGAVKVGDRPVRAGEAALPVPGELLVEAEVPARWVLLHGREQHQPIRHRGPYVD
ncbi:MAG: pirin family protein [Sandaracinaceae bacterium]